MALIYWLVALGIALILLRKFVRAITLPDSFFKKEDEDSNEPPEYNEFGYPENKRNNRA